MSNSSIGSGYPGAPHTSDTPHLLDTLVGAWSMEIAHLLAPSGIIRGQATFEWLGNRSFLIHRWEIEHTDFPDGIAVIGRGDSGKDWSMHFFDSRGVHRVSATSFRDDQWAIWRRSPGFSQRFTGVFSPVGQTITGRWEKSPEGITWEHDFDVTYCKVV